MAIKDWPASEQPREKLLSKGAAALSDAELLAIFLRTGIKGCSAVELARQLLGHFAGLRGLLEASREDVCSAPGMGAAKYTQLHAVLEIGRRHLQQALVQGDVFSSPEATRAFLTSQLRHRQQEVFLVLFLNSRHALIASREMFQGTIDGASVYPREVVKAALQHNAAALIFAHNHPSGVAEPSQADVRITRRLREALELVDIRVLDHLVIGEGEIVSLAERGLC